MLKTSHGGDLTAYSQALGVDAEMLLDFSANVNPLGLHPVIKDAIVKSIDQSHLYPDPYCTRLTQALSEVHGCDPRFIVCGNGAADIIFRCVFGLKPKKALIIAPTFSEYEKALKSAECEVLYHILSEENGFMLGEDVILAIDSTIDMVFVCNPNNPTGIIYPTQLMIKIALHCQKVGALLFVDECFNDFVVGGEVFSLIPHLKDLPAVVVLKAFTKMYSMAGVRLGYALCYDQRVIEKIYSSGQHWSVSNLAMSAGIAALSLEGYAESSALFAAQQRAYVKDQLHKLGFTTYESLANYVFFKSNVAELQELLAKKNIIIRSCHNYIGLDENYFRVGIKLAEQNEILISAIKEVIQSKL